MYKIYVLLDPRTEEVMYVGKTSNKRLHNRLCSHLCEAKKPGSKNKRCAWLKSLLNKNLKPIISQIEECDSLEKANEREIFWITYWKKYNPNLKNQQPGGDGQPKGYKFKNRYINPKGQKVKAFEEYRKRGGVRGRKRSKEENELHSKIRKGKPNPGLRKEIIIENIITGQIDKLIGYQLVIDRFGISKPVLTQYLYGRKKYYYENRFNFYYPSKKKELQFKKIIRANKDDHIIIFYSVIECAKYFNIDRNIIYDKIKN